VNIATRRVETGNCTSNLLKTMFAKSHAEDLAVTSFAPICLCTHPLLPCTRSDTLFFFAVSKIIWVSKTHDGYKDALVTIGKFSINFCSNQSKCAKRSTMFLLSLTCPRRINLTQTNNFTVRMLCSEFQHHDYPTF